MTFQRYTIVGDGTRGEHGLLVPYAVYDWQENRQAKVCDTYADALSSLKALQESTD